MNVYMKYLIKECYEEDYDPVYAETWLDNYCFEYTFVEWYFLYRVKMRLCVPCYKHTSDRLMVGWVNKIDSLIYKPTNPQK